MIDAEGYAALLQHFARYFAACDSYDIDEVMDILSGATVNAGGTSTSDAAELRTLYETRQPAPLSDGRRLTKADRHLVRVRLL